MVSSSALARAAMSLLVGPSLRCSMQTLQPQQRGMAVVVNVQRNNVDQAIGTLNKRCKEAGLVEELRKRQHRVSSQEAKFARIRNQFKMDMGHMIRDRLKWIMKRRKTRPM